MVALRSHHLHSFPGAHPDQAGFERLNASGFIDGVVPFQDGFLVNFVYDNPNAKVVGTGEFVVIGEVDGAPLYLELITPDSSFPAFQKCPRLTTG